MRHIILKVQTGSKAYGLATATSDDDIRGVYVPPLQEQWGLALPPEQISGPGEDEVYTELRKFVRLALKANPSILEFLWSPLLDCEVVGLHLLHIRDRFLSKRAYKTYGGYANAQLAKAIARGENGEPDWKNAMHLCRLLIAGGVLLREGRLMVEVDEQYRERLLVVRSGKVSWKAVQAWAAELDEELNDAYVCSVLPDEPDTEEVARVMGRIYAECAVREMRGEQETIFAAMIAPFKKK